MKLFVFRPQGYGEETFIITEVDETAAKKAVDKFIEDKKLEYEDYLIKCRQVTSLRGGSTYVPNLPEYQYPKTMHPIDSSGWGTDYYVMEIYEPGQVAINENQ